MIRSGRRSAAVLLFLMLTACGSIRPDGVARDEQVPCRRSGDVPASPFLDGPARYVFKASLDIRDRHLSGRMYVKKMADSSCRIAFLNEFGMTWFDVIMKRDSFEVAYCFEPLNRKAVLRLLRTNFELLFQARSGPGHVRWYRQKDTGNSILRSRDERYLTWFTADSTCRVIGVAGKTDLIDRTEIIFSGYQQGIPSTVRVKSLVVGMEMRLDRDQ